MFNLIQRDMDKVCKVNGSESIGSQFKLDSVSKSIGFKDYIEVFDAIKIEEMASQLETKFEIPWEEPNERTQLVDCLMTVFCNYRMDYLFDHKGIEIVEEAIDFCLNPKYGCHIYNARPFADIIKVRIQARRNNRRNGRWVEFVLVPIKK